MKKISISIATLLLLTLCIAGCNQVRKNETTVPLSTQIETTVSPTTSPEATDIPTTEVPTTEKVIETTYQAQVVSLADIPAYSGNAYVEINGNTPYFTSSDYTTISFESYSDLDSLGRCGVAVACIGTDIMPTEKRGAIGMVKPSGWHTVRYDDLISDKYLYLQFLRREQTLQTYGGFWRTEQGELSYLLQSSLQLKPKHQTHLRLQSKLQQRFFSSHSGYSPHRSKSVLPYRSSFLIINLIDRAAPFTAAVYPTMSPSSALFGNLFFRGVFSKPAAVDHRTGIGIIPLLISAADADGMGYLTGSGKGTVIIVDKVVMGLAADFTAAFFIKMV